MTKFFYCSIVIIAKGWKWVNVQHIKTKQSKHIVCSVSSICLKEIWKNISIFLVYALKKPLEEKSRNLTVVKHWVEMNGWGT